MQDSGILTLLSAADSFLIDIESKKSVIAGYHWFGEWGRDAMISLPGLTLVQGKFDAAERILERFLNRLSVGRIPTNFDGGMSKYYDFDGTLWMIDRVKDYVDYAGVERGRAFLHTYWWGLKDAMKIYGETVRNGILHHKAGTWMDTLDRSNAVELQGLWYNALKTMGDLSKVMVDNVDYSGLISGFEENFMARFWNGRYLNDTLTDDSLRPNQVIALSMDYSPVPEKQAVEVLDLVRSELLTPYGLRTLGRSHRDYVGRYSGSPEARDKAYHNGSVWPWLLGPYIKACMKYKRYNKIEGVKLLEPLLTSHLSEAGLGTVSELFDGDEPHAPRGCISQAWSVAELIRAYYEDIMGGKPSAALL
jgi:predicted glycogen debranching enzyme